MPPFGQHLTQLEQAHGIALVVWAALFLIIYPSKVYYLGMCLLLVLSVGAVSLEYAPALWVPVQLVLSGYSFFKKAWSVFTGGRKAG